MAANFQPIPTTESDSNEYELVEGTQEPLLSRYDPYHNITYYVHHPFSGKPLTGEEVNAKALLYGATNPSWKLDYQDFAPVVIGLEYNAPQCHEHFQDLVDRANCWLRQNPQVNVRTCETVNWWVSEPINVGDTESVILEQCSCTQPDTDTFYLSGLRLWVVPSVEGGDKLQQLRCRNYQAAEKETLTHLVRRVNRQLEDDPCPGKIITTETVLVPEIVNWDNSRTLWSESQCSQKGEYTLLLRIFFVEGEPYQESIGIKNICPEVVSGGHEPFNSLMQKARCWVNDQRDIQVTNLKSTYVSRQNDCPAECANRCKHHYFKFANHQYFQIIRVFYVKRLCSAPSSYHMLNYATFTPVQTLLGPTTYVPFEKMRHTMVRTTAWLRAAGAEVFCAETITTPMIPSIPSQTLPEVTYWTPTSAASEGNVKKCLMHIRVYLDGEYTEPDPNLLPPLPLSLTTSLQATLRQRELRRMIKKKQRSKRRKRILLIIAFFILAVGGGVIILDQVFNVFGL